MPACETGSHEANLIPSVRLDNIVVLYLSDGVQRAANKMKFYRNCE